MSSLGNTLFLKMLEAKQQQNALMREQAAAKLQEDQSSQKMMSELFKNQMAAQDKHFERQMQLLMAQGKAAGQLGTEQPTVPQENSQLKQAGEVGYMQGLVANQQDEFKQAATIQGLLLKERTADRQDVGAQERSRTLQEMLKNKEEDQAFAKQQFDWRKKQDVQDRQLQEQALQKKWDTDATRLQYMDFKAKAGLREKTLQKVAELGIPEALGSIRRAEGVLAKYPVGTGPAALNMSSDVVRKFLTATVKDISSGRGAPSLSDWASNTTDASAVALMMQDKDAAEFLGAVTQLGNAYTKMISGSAVTTGEYERMKSMLANLPDQTWPQRIEALKQIRAIIETKANTYVASSSGTVDLEDFATAAAGTYRPIAQQPAVMEPAPAPVPQQGSIGGAPLQNLFKVQP